jgi:uncharacterized protein (TIGR03435 family)
MKLLLGLLALFLAAYAGTAKAQTVFAVASIRPSTTDVKFEADGATETQPGHLKMRDVTVGTCIKWAYGVQQSQIAGPGWMSQVRYDIEAKADGPASVDEMHAMMQALLAERFGLRFHREQHELKGFALTVAKGGSKVKPTLGEGAMYRQNGANGTVARFMTMQEFADFMSGPMEAPILDRTGLPGKYDFVLDFTNYLPADAKTMHRDMTDVIITALQGELGLKLEARKVVMPVMVVDRVEKPSEN